MEVVPSVCPLLHQRRRLYNLIYWNALPLPIQERSLGSFEQHVKIQSDGSFPRICNTINTFHVIVWRVYFKMGRRAQKILLFQAGHNSAWPWAWQPRVSDLVSFERRWQQCWMYRDSGEVRRPSRCVHYRSLCTSACVKLLKVFESASEKDEHCFNAN